MPWTFSTRNNSPPHEASVPVLVGGGTPFTLVKRGDERGVCNGEESERGEKQLMVENARRITSDDQACWKCWLARNSR